MQAWVPGFVKQTFKSNRNMTYSCKYHVVWCPKYRRKVLVGGYPRLRG